MRLVTFFMFLSSLLFSKPHLPQNFQADFEQKITNSKNGVITYEGNVLFSDKKLFKWSYVSPTKKEVCSDGSELLIVDHDLEQVATYYIAKGFDIAQILESSKEHSKNIYVADYQGKTYTIQFDNKQRLHSMAYYDELENKVQIIFKNMKYGKSTLSERKMECSYPEIYDRIRG